jgi:hypothetical protein
VEDISIERVCFSFKTVELNADRNRVTQPAQTVVSGDIVMLIEDTDVCAEAGGEVCSITAIWSPRTTVGRNLGTIFTRFICFRVTVFHHTVEITSLKKEETRCVIACS